ncbi:MAG TPA: DHA2 family efflux MFS transporter permease subunit [Gammaproteobacteria bacterium]|nr:DHA2 family efflux MFS transporter permease subunit [Gammaproteobacteria bacterium]
MNLQRFLISVAVMAATVMQVLDTTIVNVALPHMQGELSATPDQISWVITSYLVSSGIFMVLTGYFTSRFGQKPFLLLSIVGFVAASALCGLSSNLSEIVLFRLLQGISGAALVPLSQSIMVATFPREDRGKAMAIWGMGVMVGPILGPTLGGWLTEFISWRWTFFINVPVGLLSAFLVLRYIPDTEKNPRGMDWMGLTLIALGVAGLQFVLDRGAQEDWFASPLIQFSAYLSCVGFIGFLWHIRSYQGHALFSPAIFTDRNFVVASLLMAFLGLGLFGSMILQPLMLEGLLGYPTLTTGLTLAPRGLASMFSMMLVGRLINRYDPRLLIVAGIAIFGFGSYLTTQYSLQMGMAWVVAPMILQGMGLGMVFIPLSTLAFSTLPPQYSAEAAGMYSLLRTIGSGIGVSVVVSVLTRHAQVAWHNVGGHVQPFNAALAPYLNQLGMTEQSPQAAAILAKELARQAQMIGFLDAYIFVTVAFCAMLPLVFVMRNTSSQSPAAAPPQAAAPPVTR